jgi:hypothetical protein
MNKKQSNKLNAYVSVLGVLNKNRRICNSIPMLAQTVGEFGSLVQEIKEVGAWMEMDTTGETAAKGLAKEQLARLASGLAAAGMAFAFDRSDREMELALDYAYYKIRYARDADTLEITGAIAEVLGQYQGELIPYLVTEEDLAGLFQHREAFRKAMEVKGGAKSGRVADTRKLAQLFDFCDEMLHRKLDRLMLRLEGAYPDFFVAYRYARTIVDR